MNESMFGVEMPLAVRFFLAFLILLGLIGASLWAVRRFGTGRLGSTGARGRQPRLAVIDYASVDTRRRLILVRRDNVEHLLMIGGPTDVVVEANIVRAVAAPREVPPARPPVVAEPRAVPTVPLPESGNGTWPLQPEPALPLRPARMEPTPRGEPMPRIEQAAEESAAWPLQPQAEGPSRPQRDTLAALADELSSRPAPPPSAPPQRARMPAAPRPNTAEARPAPRVSPIPPPTSAAAPTEDPTADQSLAEMAHRLEAALRKPSVSAEARAPAPTRGAAPTAPAEPAPDPEAAPPPPRAAARTPEQPQAPRPDATPGQGKNLYDSLEQEMASLLGRPTGKP